MKSLLKETVGLAESQLWVQRGPEVETQLPLPLNDKEKLGYPTARIPTKNMTTMPNLVGRIIFDSAVLQLMDIMKASV
jgi:hypothetical protein